MNDQDSPPSAASGLPEALIERARNLFEFLAQAQRLRTKPVLDVESYARDGEVLWLTELPLHPAVEFDIEAYRLTVARIPPREHPDPPERLERWILGELDDPTSALSLRDEIMPDSDSGLPPSQPIRRLELSSTDRQLLDGWMSDWQRWAEAERTDRPVRDLYRRLFRLQSEFQNRPEELELLGCSGLLAWDQPGASRLRRHLLVHPLSVRFNAQSGLISLAPDPSGRVASRGERLPFAERAERSGERGPDSQ